MVVGDREHEVGAQSEIGREESHGGAVVIADLCAYIGDVEAPRELAFAAADHRISDEISGDVGAESVGGGIGLARV